MRATDGTMRFTLFADDAYRQLAARIAAASICLALAVALFLLARRATGALSTSLPAAQLVTTATIIAAWAISVRELTLRNRQVRALTFVVVALFAIACSFPGPRLVDWLAWGAAFTVIIWLPSKRRDQPLSVLPAPAPQPTPHLADLESDLEPEAESEFVLQQLTRIRTDEGHDAIRGSLIAEFAAGERQATLYAAFCPPFERLPELEVNVADDSDASVKVSQLLHNGVQLEVRLATPADEPTSVAIEFFAINAE